MAAEASAEDFEHEFEFVGGAWSVDNGEGAVGEGGGDLALFVAQGSATLDDDGGRRGVEAGEQVEQAWAGFLGAGRAGGLAGAGAGEAVAREAEIDDGDVDLEAADDVLGLPRRSGSEAAYAHRLKEAGQAIDPWVFVPAAVRQEEVEA